MGVFWLIAFLIFAVTEALTVGLTSVWFAAGAVGALVVSGRGGELWLQIVVFLAVSFITLLVGRPLASKYLIPKTEPTNFDRVIGRDAVVTEAVDNLKGQGLVSVSGSVWSARAQDDAVIPVGTKVRILRIEGVKVFVTPVAVSAETN